MDKKDALKKWKAAVSDYHRIVEKLEALGQLLEEIRKRNTIEQEDPRGILILGSIPSADDVLYDIEITESIKRSLANQALACHPITLEFGDPGITLAILKEIGHDGLTVFSNVIEQYGTGTRFMQPVLQHIDGFNLSVSPVADFNYREIVWGQTIVVKFLRQDPYVSRLKHPSVARIKAAYVADDDILYYEIVSIEMV